MKNLLVNLLICLGVLHSAHSSPKHLPQGWYPIEEVAHTCKIAFIGKLISFESPVLGPPACSFYKSLWLPQFYLKGSGLMVPQKFLFSIQTFPEKEQESMPIIGESYIVLTYPKSAYQISYIAPADEKTLNFIKGLLHNKTEQGAAANP